MLVLLCKSLIKFDIIFFAKYKYFPTYPIFFRWPETQDFFLDLISIWENLGAPPLKDWQNLGTLFRKIAKSGPSQ